MEKSVMKIPWLKKEILPAIIERGFQFQIHINVRS